MHRLWLLFCVTAVGCEPLTPGVGVEALVERPSSLQDGTPLDAVSWWGQGHRGAIGRLEYLDGTPQCTGTVVHERAVLTAAHCFALPYPANPLEVAIELGSLRFRSLEGSATLAGLARHPELDVAVVFLADALETGTLAITMSRRVPAALAGEALLAVGAGRGTPMDELVVAGEFIVEALEDDELALSPAADARICGGDSGGPLLRVVEGEPEIVGVIARGFPDCSPPSYAVRADRIFPWLDEVIAQPPPELEACDSTAESHHCDQGDAHRCEEEYWRRYPCAEVHYACVMDENMATCEPVPCGQISATGRCEEGIARVCLGGTLATFDCIAQGQGCELLVEEARVGCVACTACEGQCVDHATDSLHCGTCGVECAPSGRGRCVDGECVRPASAEDTEEPPSPPATSGDTGDNFEPSLRLDCASCPLSPREFAMMSALALLPPVISSFRRRQRRRRAG